jgi:hypothetical protein
MQITSAPASILDQFHQIFEIISGVAMVCATIVTMMIKVSLGHIREGQLENQLKNERYQASIKEELTKHQTKLASDLRDHETRDEGQFKLMTQTLIRIEKSLNGGSHKG